MSQFINDTFTDTAGVVVQAHTSDSGGTWSKHPVFNAGAYISDENRARGAGAEAVFVHPTSPSSAEYDVEVDVVVKSADVGSYVGLLGRLHPTDDTGYVALYERDTGTWYLNRRLAGANLVLGTYVQSLSAGQTVRVRLSIRDEAKKLYLDGVEKISSANNEVTAANSAGLWVGGDSTDGTGVHVDNYTADAFVAPPISLSSPRSYQVFQRTGSTGTIAIAGTNNGGGTHSVEASWNGLAYVTIATGVANGAAFSGTLAAVPQGQGTLTVRFVDAPTSFAAVPFVGVGDIYVTAGQSNANGYATNAQTYDPASAFKPGKHSPGSGWVEMTDPYVSGGGGSQWTPLSSLLHASLGVPVGFIPVAVDGSRITSWITGQANYTAAVARIAAATEAGVGRVRLWLWHQGESDGVDGMSQATYNAHLDTLAANVSADLGVKVMPCKLQNCSGVSDVEEDALRAAVGEAWADNANVLAGPDLSDIASDDSFHIQSDANIATAASRWSAAITAAFLYRARRRPGSSRTGTRTPIYG